MRLVLCALALAACRPRVADPSPASSIDVEQVLAAPLAPAEPAPEDIREPDPREPEQSREARRDMVRRESKRDTLGLPAEPPGEPMCGDRRPDRCYLVLKGWWFALRVDMQPPTAASAEERQAAHRSRAAVRRRVVEAELDLVACGHEAVRRDPCLRRDLAVGFTIGRAGGPIPGRVEGDPGAEAIRCLSSEVARLNLPRLLDPEASTVEVLVRLDYIPPSYSMYVAAGRDGWFGPASTRYVDVPCRSA